MEQISRRTLLAAFGTIGPVTVAGCSGGGAPDDGRIDTSSTHYVGGAETSGSGGSAPSGSASSGSGSGGSGSSTSAEPALSRVDLPAPDELRNRWAAVAAGWVAAEVSDDGSGPRAEQGDWLYMQETGQWAHLVRFTDGRAVLVGQSEPDTLRNATQEKESRAALLAGAPSWWGTFEEVLPDNTPVGFVLGWDRKQWQQVAAAPTAGGFSTLLFYPESPELAGEWLLLWGREGEGEYSGAQKATADAVMRAGTQVNASQLQRLGPGMRTARLKDAVAAARAFAGAGRH